MPTNQDPLVLTIDQCEPLVLTVNPPYVGAAFSPTVDITETPDDVTVTITDIDGEHSYTIEKTDQAISAAETAAASANSAASSATTAAENANAAASRVDSAIADAEDAADAANAAAELATAKAELADDAAALANTKAGLADVAAENANAKATLADNAASSASSAASQAASAADDAENATTAANSAATSASDAASSANDAATLASEKAELADIAATNASDKASLADTAAATASASAANADAKATAADTAANAANNAASTASAAATNANDKATLADNAATNANAKANLANAAASNADTKAGYADNAATAANTAASAANVAASAANTAATNADVKADLAELAAENADNKAALANTAANTANNAANAASAAATRADTSADNADAAADRVDTAIDDAESATTAANSAATSANDAAARVDAALETLDDDLKISDSGGGASVLTNGCALLDVSGDGWAEQDGTPTPENPVPVRVAKGRNLLDMSKLRIGEAWNAVSNPNRAAVYINCEPNTTYIVSVENRGVFSAIIVYQKESESAQSVSGDDGAQISGTNKTSVITTSAASKVIGVGFNKSSAITAQDFDGLHIQLEAGSTATPYVPYGHVGLEIKQGSTLVDCIPVPIPEEGLASVSDGTKDLLRIDSAGHVVAGKRVSKYVVTGNETITGTTQYTTYRRTLIQPSIASGKPTAQSSGICTHAPYVASTSEDSLHVCLNSITLALFAVGDSDVAVLSQYVGATLYYALATPTAIDMGYIDLPLMPDGCTVSIPELHEIDVEWVVTRAEAIPDMVADVRKWALHEIALAGDAELSTIAAVENATASTNYAVGSYLVHAGTLYRVTTAIATGETITPGSNVTATTVMAELIRLTA